MKTIIKLKKAGSIALPLMLLLMLNSCIGYSFSKGMGNTPPSQPNPEIVPWRKSPVYRASQEERSDGQALGATGERMP